jgi:hypothetical protein
MLKCEHIAMCVVCEQSRFNTLYTGILRCRNCGHVFSDLHMSDCELFKLYERRRTLRFLLDRCGFEVVYGRYCGFFRSVDNMAYNVLVLRHRMSAIYCLLKTGLTRLNVYP